MKLSEYPDLSRKFRRIYQIYLKKGGNPLEGLTLAEDFLEEYPFYSEALVFKARMLIALSRNKEAMKCLRAAERLDEWRVSYGFDKAEVLYNFGRKEEAVDCLWKSVESSLREILDGIENFLLGLDYDCEKRDLAKKVIEHELKQIISGRAHKDFGVEICKVLEISRDKPTEGESVHL